MRTTLLILLLASAADGATLAGKVTIKSGSEKPGRVIVYAEHLDGEAPPASGQFTLAQKNKAFTPAVLPVPKGATVNFPNQDSIFHNVFSLSRPQPFDLGLYRSGASKSQTFTAPATYRVFCNIHPQMTAIILVTPTPYFAEADASGAFRLEVPSGRYRVTAWSERAQPATVEAVSGVSDIALSLDESQFVETPHKNKFGQDYPKSAYDPKRK